MAILLIVLVIFLVFLVGLLLAFLVSRTDHAVTGMRLGIAAEEKSYNPGVTLGHKVKVEAGYDEQMKQARLQAAKRAAAIPRGANNQIGRAGDSTLITASKNLKNDPMTSVRIARFHGWDGARAGAPAVGAPVAVAPVAAAGTAARPAVTAGIAPPTLITITPDMPPEEVRKARVANAKAEAAYNKALKAAAAGAPPPAAGVAAPAAAAPAAVAPVVTGIEPPKLIEITPGMPPEEVRKARVANAKAEAAYNKALKAAGVAAGTTAGVAAVVDAAMPGPATAATPPVAAAPPMAGIEPPKLIEITPGMAPEEVRKARVANAKAEAAYHKALKAAGIDPATLKGGSAIVATSASSPAPAAPVEAAAPAAPADTSTVPANAPAATAAMAAGIERPALIEITDSMTPEQIRRARVDNAKAMAAYNKALKAAGIDPATVK
jgi:hypothetical protein